MGKISGGDRPRYLERIKPYTAAIEQGLRQEELALASLQGEIPAPAAAAKRLGLARDMINLATNYIVLSSMSQSMLRMKNEEALNEGRKSLYKSVVYLEEIIGKQIDAPFSEYEERLEAIGDMGAERRYLLIRKLGLAIQLLEDAYGDQSRWRWAFVELEGRFAAAAKNIIDLKAAFYDMDPRSPEYEPARRLLILAKKLLARAADRYRSRYELSTGQIDDFNRGIQFLSALKRLHGLLNEREQAETVRKKLDIWTAKLEGDQRKQEAAAPKKA
jgi:hypothetical protein